MNKIKIHAYNNGEVFTSYMRVAAVLIRDRFFKEHGISPDKVDKHDPNINQ